MPLSPRNSQSSCQIGAAERVDQTFLKKHKELAADFDENLEAARAMKSDYDQVKSNLDDMETCLIIASTFEAAKLCAQ